MAYEPWQPGMRITAGRLASISPTWQAWTPEWSTSSGTSLPNFGDATVNCAYAISARTVYWRMEIIFGSTTAFGGGGTGDNYLFSLPVAAAEILPAIGFLELNASVGKRAVARARMLTTDDFCLEVSSGTPDATVISNTGIADAVSPWTWASGDAIRGSGQYEAAS